MEMDWATAMIGAVAILICVVPIVMINYKRVQREKGMLKIITELAEREQCKISKFEYCGDFILGMDEGKRTLFFHKSKTDLPSAESISLGEMKVCQITRKASMNAENSNGLGLINQIYLSFIPKDGKSPEVNLELYDVKKNIQLSGELQFAEKYVKTLNNLMKNK